MTTPAILEVKAAVLAGDHDKLDASLDCQASTEYRAQKSGEMTTVCTYSAYIRRSSLREILPRIRYAGPLPCRIPLSPSHGPGQVPVNRSALAGQAEARVDGFMAMLKNRLPSVKNVRHLQAQRIQYLLGSQSRAKAGCFDQPTIAWPTREAFLVQCLGSNS